MSLRASESSGYKLSSMRGHETIIEALGRMAEIKELWIVEEGGSGTYEGDAHNGQTYSVFAFTDANDVIAKLRPDVVLTYGGDYEFLSRSLLKAAAHKKIPSVDIRLFTFMFDAVEKTGIDKSKIVGKAYILFRRNTTILRKYMFLLRTLIHAHYNWTYIVRTVIKDITLPFVSWSPMYRFGGADLNIVSTPQWSSFLMENGIDREKIRVAGEISMDGIFNKITAFKNSKEEKNFGKNTSGKKIEALFVTDSLVEHGYWTPQMRNNLVSSVVKGIKEGCGDVNLRIKIHPSSENLETYRRLLLEEHQDIEIIQNCDLFSLLVESDIVITFGHSSGIFEAILLGKPVYLLNFYKESLKNIFIEGKIVFECKSVEELLIGIRKKTYEKLNKNDIEAFIVKHLYMFDGKCSERAAQEIMRLLDKHDEEKILDSKVTT